MRASDIWRSTLVEGFTVAELESAREIIRRVTARVAEVPIQPSRVGAALDSGAPVRDTGSALGVPENF